jgi:hypothetical protein
MLISLKRKLFSIFSIGDDNFWKQDGENEKRRGEIELRYPS